MRKANNNHIDHEYSDQAESNKTKRIKEYANSFDNKTVQNIESLMSDIDLGCDGGVSHDIKP